MAKKQEPRIIGSRLGKIEVAPERVIYFPRGLIGFDKHREFTLVEINKESPFLILQSMTDPAFGLLVCDPFSFMGEYEVVLAEPDRKVLHINSLRDVALLVTVSIPHGRPELTTLNLTGPIVMNFKDRLGLQVPQTDSKYPSHYRPNQDDSAPVALSNASDEPQASEGRGELKAGTGPRRASEPEDSAEQDPQDG